MQVYEALSSKNWGASTTLMHDIAGETFDYEKYSQIMKLIWQALENSARTWKLLFKTLTLIQFLIKNGNERVVEECRDHLHQIRPLQDYNYYESTVDKGSGVRDLSKAIVELLASNDAIRSEREKARQLRHKFTGVGSDGRGSYGNDPQRSGGGYAERGIGSDDFNRGRRDSYRDNSDSNKGRGGGAYDSERPNRFNDDRRNDSEQDLDYASKMRSRRDANKTSTSNGGPKLKVNIKGSTISKVSKSSKQSTSDVDLLGTVEPDLLGGNETAKPAATFAEVSNFDNFNGFSSAAPIQPQGMFDAFNSDITASTAQQGFNANLMNQAAPTMPQRIYFQQQQPPEQLSQIQQCSQTQLPVQQQQFNNSFDHPELQQMSMQSTQPQYSLPQQLQPQPQQQQLTQQSPPTVFQIAKPVEETDFGGFESAPTSEIFKPVIENKFASFGGLVDLGGLTSKSVEEAKKQQTAMAQPAGVSNSFSGLDGFSKSSTGNMGMSMQGGMSLHPMMHGGPAMMSNQGYGQQQMNPQQFNQLQMNQPQMQIQPMNMLMGQQAGMVSQGNPMMMNSMQQQQSMQQLRPQMQHGVTSQQQHPHFGSYSQQRSQFS